MVIYIQGDDTVKKQRIEKINLKNREFTNYLLDPPTYELGTFSANANLKYEKCFTAKIMGVVFK